MSARRWLVDVTVAGLVLVASVAAAITQRIPLPGLLLAVGACACLPLRRRWPTVSFALSTVLAEASLATWGNDAAVLLLAAPLVCLYTVADRSGWRLATVAGGTALVLLFVLHAGWQPAWATAQNVALLGFGGFAVAAGEAVRSRRAQLAAMAEQARQAEFKAEDDAARRVSDERLRIARDLHDVLGHQLALISVHAGVAAESVSCRPVQAVLSLRHIKTASGTALTDLRDVVVLLRSPDERTGGGAGVNPYPACTLDRLDALLDLFRGSGMQVEVQTDGLPRRLPAAVDVTAYRVIQESLTNVAKHSGGTVARVRLGYRRNELQIMVEDDGLASGRASAPGHGLRGMHERVALHGGWLHASPRTQGGFAVQAMLPATPDPEGKGLDAAGLTGTSDDAR